MIDAQKLNVISDVIHIDGSRLPFHNILKRPPAEWIIDCLPYGYIRIFCQGTITCSYPVSDFEIYRNDFPLFDSRRFKMDVMERGIVLLSKNSRAKKKDRMKHPFFFLLRKEKT